MKLDNIQDVLNNLRGFYRFADRFTALLAIDKMHGDETGLILRQLQSFGILDQLQRFHRSGEFARIEFLDFPQQRVFELFILFCALDHKMNVVGQADVNYVAPFQRSFLSVPDG